MGIIHNVRRVGQRLNQATNGNMREAPLDNSSGSSDDSSYGSVASLLPQPDANSINFLSSEEDVSLNTGPSTSRVTVEIANEVTTCRNEHVI